EPDGDGPGLRRVHPRAGGERAEAGRRVVNVVLTLRVRTEGGRPPGPRGAIGARVAILTRSVRTTLTTGHFAFNTTTATASLLAARSSSGTSFPPGDTITLRLSPSRSAHSAGGTSRPSSRSTWVRFGSRVM